MLFVWVLTCLLFHVSSLRVGCKGPSRTLLFASSIDHSNPDPVLYDRESRGRSSVLVAREAVIKKSMPKSLKPKQRQSCVFDSSRDCSLGRPCHVDSRPCSSARGYLNKSFGVNRVNRDSEKSYGDVYDSEQPRTRNNKHQPPMNPPTMKYTTIPSRRYEAVDLETKEKKHHDNHGNPIDTYLVTKEGTHTIILDLEKLSKDWGTYVLPHPTSSKSPAVNFMHNSIKVASRVTDIFVDQVVKFFLILAVPPTLR